MVAVSRVCCVKRVSGLLIQALHTMYLAVILTLQPHTMLTKVLPENVIMD